jgi:hypothetical protein
MNVSWLYRHDALVVVIALIVIMTIAAELDKHRGLPARIIVTVLLSATIYVVLDLDRPHEGLIHISQSPMLHLQSILEGDPETKP